VIIIADANPDNVPPKLPPVKAVALTTTKFP
jgi:hypothetical protein